MNSIANHIVGLLFVNQKACWSPEYRYSDFYSYAGRTFFEHLITAH